MNGFVFTLFFVPLIAFVVIVLPIWITFHYRDKSRAGRELNADEWQEISKTLEQAERLEQRVASLESILDNQTPDWRKHHVP